jgi:hypothetical protein
MAAVEPAVGAAGQHPANPREEPGDLAELEASIRELGVLEPLVVATVAAHRVGGWPDADRAPRTCGWPRTGATGGSPGVYRARRPRLVAAADRPARMGRKQPHVSKRMALRRLSPRRGDRGPRRRPGRPSRSPGPSFTATSTPPASKRPWRGCGRPAVAAGPASLDPLDPLSPGADSLTSMTFPVTSPTRVGCG